MIKANHKIKHFRKQMASVINYHWSMLVDDIVFLQCFLWGWYLANDMQFYIIAPAILFTAYRYCV